MTLSANPTYTSDYRIKKNIRPLEENIIDKLSSLNAIKYNKKHPSEMTELYGPLSDTMKYLPINDESYTKDRIGLIAQEVQEVFPELVSEDGNGILTLNYVSLIPILIEAIKEQQEQIVSITSKIGGEKSASISGLSTSVNPSKFELDNEAVLYQNAPNPFDESTFIKYSIPAIKQYAMINIYDLQGNQVKSIEVLNTGNGEVKIPASELYPGLFIYNLIVDGIEVSSRQMILTD